MFRKKEQKEKNREISLCILVFLVRLVCATENGREKLRAPVNNTNIIIKRNRDIHRKFQKTHRKTLIENGIFNKRITRRKRERELG